MNNNYLTRFSVIESKLQQLQTSTFGKIWIMTIWGGLRRGQRTFRLNFCSLDEKCWFLDLCDTGSCSPVSQSEVRGLNPVWSQRQSFRNCRIVETSTATIFFAFYPLSRNYNFRFSCSHYSAWYLFCIMILYKVSYNADFSTENSNIVEVEHVCVLLYPFESVYVNSETLESNGCDLNRLRASQHMHSHDK